MLILRWNRGRECIYSENNMYYVIRSDTPKAQMTLLESWELDGMYVFTGNLDYEWLVRKVRSILDDGARFCWVNETGGFGGVIYCDGNQLRRYAQLGYAPCRLFIRKGAVVGVLENGFVITPTFTLCINNAKITPNGGQIRLKSDGFLEFDGIADKLPELRMTYYIGDSIAESQFFCDAEDLLVKCFWNPAQFFASYIAVGSGLSFRSGFADWVGKPVCLFSTETSILSIERGAWYSYLEKDTINTIDTLPRPYTSLGGDFLVTADRILCGICGTEYLECGGLLQLRRGGSSFVDSHNKLIGLTTTPYIRLPKGARYISQPQSAPFFSPGSTAALGFCGLPLACFTVESESFPMMGYVGVTCVDLSIPTLETVLQAERYEKLSMELVQNLASSEDFIAVTPHGVCVGVSAGEDGEWKWIGLANTTSQAATLPNIRFDAPKPELRKRFQDPRCCMLYDEAKELLELADIPNGFQFEVDGFRFNIAPEKWLPGRTTMLIKLNGHRSIAEQCESNHLLKAAIRSAHDNRGNAKPQYADFLSAVNAADFQGIVLLNVAVTINRSDVNFPKALSAVIDSIDESRLVAHHVVFRRGQVEDILGNIHLLPSDSAAVLEYRHPSTFSYDLKTSRKPYDFETTELLITVSAGRIQSISSISELLITVFFGSAARKTHGSAGESLVIEGFLQTGITQAYRYRLREGGVYELTGSGVAEIELDDLVMTTADTLTRFNLSGLLRFIEDANGDIFGYGGSGGLRFEGLYITKQADFNMHYDEMVLRPLGSTPRENGLPARFPAVPARFYALAVPPEDMGFISITAPIGQGKLTAEWFGVEYTLSLGVMGELSSGVDFRVRLLVAWSVGKETPLFYVGLSFPGSGLELQGIFRIGFSSIRLECDKKTDPHNFKLVLNQFGITALGMSFPKGTNALYILGNGANTKPGWFADYKEK